MPQGADRDGPIYLQFTPGRDVTSLSRPLWYVDYIQLPLGKPAVSNSPWPFTNTHEGVLRLDYARGSLW